ncbi:helix-turn-helix transcriptional regulator [Yersinia rohdei]|uniref:helix-turn-helix transcriptional regulator n=1 Tax=Yersinia rohdei TaxID=29485 RepID=UPI0011A29364|nr:LuxR C-terminal-related transcriptional regulator [Yersinia rohdei]
MNNVIIFSQYDLVRFYLKKAIENISIMRSKRGNVSIRICYSLSEFENEIQEQDNPIIIFDLDGIEKFEQFRLFKLAKEKVSHCRLFLFTSESEGSGSYTTLKQVSPFILSKTASQSQIETMFYQLIFCFKAVQKTKISAEKTLCTHKDKTALTHRESEICRHLLSGLSNKEIGILLGISNKTVSSHRTNIYGKYQAKNLIELYSRVKI